MSTTMRKNFWIGTACRKSWTNIANSCLYLFNLAPRPNRFPTEKTRKENRNTSRLKRTILLITHHLPGPASLPISQTKRSEERRGGKECVSTCRSRGSADH